MSQPASSRSKTIAVTLVAVVAAAVAVFAVARLGGDDDPVQRGQTRPTTTTDAPTTVPSASDTPKPDGECEGPDTQFNVEGVEKDSLLPDCGTPPVTVEEEKEKGLGLGCGGSYPIILFKTTTTDAKTSICGKTSSGEEFRFVTQADGEDVLDLPGYYDPGADAFVAEDGDVVYAVQAYDGTLVVTRDGESTEQPSKDWITLDNESDYD